MFSIRTLHFCIGLIVLPITGCLGPKVQLEVAFCDPGFTKQILKGKSVALAEVVLARGTDYFPNEVQKDLILKDLQNQLAGSGREIHVMGPSSSPASVVTLRRDADWLASGVLRTPLHRSEMERLQAAGCAYLMVLVLQSNSIDERIARFDQTTTDVETDKDGKEVFRTEVTTYYTSAKSCRRIQACYYLFDLKTGHNVWRINGGFSGCSVSTESSTSGYPEPPLFTPAPGEAEVLEDISKAVLKKLPR